MLFYEVIRYSFLYFAGFIGSVFGLYGLIVGVEWLTRKFRH